MFTNTKTLIVLVLASPVLSMMKGFDNLYEEEDYGNAMENKEMSDITGVPTPEIINTGEYLANIEDMNKVFLAEKKRQRNKKSRYAAAVLLGGAGVLTGMCLAEVGVNTHSHLFSSLGQGGFFNYALPAIIAVCAALGAALLVQSLINKEDGIFGHWSRIFFHSMWIMTFLATGSFMCGLHFMEQTAPDVGTAIQNALHGFTVDGTVHGSDAVVLSQVTMIVSVVLFALIAIGALLAFGQWCQKKVIE